MVKLRLIALTFLKMRHNVTLSTKWRRAQLTPTAPQIRRIAMSRTAPRVALLFLACCANGSAGLADPVADFYRGKQVRMVIGMPAGSGYDFHARLLARHLGRHIPGEPIVISQNMVGAASIKAANYVYEGAAKDGLTIGAINRSTALGPLLDTTINQVISFDALKFGWLGTINSTVTVGITLENSGIRSIDDLFKREVVVSADSPSSDSYVYSYMLNNLLGTKLKVISGYAGTNSSFLALERGETQAYMGSSYSSLMSTKPDWVRDKTVRFLIQIAVDKDPRLPDVPLVTEYATGAHNQALELILAPQQMGRAYMTTPGVEPARLAALRAAFMATMKDPQFLAEAKQLNVDVDPIDGQGVQDLLTRLYKTPSDAVEAAKKALVVPK
jgi:tripartite-type tricarboxylate transporter receptor subunit TctC